MRSTVAFCLIGLGLLTACGTPQERCIARETRDLRVVERLIAETEADLQRGYALEEVTIWTPRWQICESQPPASDDATSPPPRMCLEDEATTVTRPKAINLAQTRETLIELRKKRLELIQQSRAAVDACRVAHPE